MPRDDDRCTLDPALTALALRGLSKPASYPFVERHLWRRRAAGLFVALRALRGQRSQRERPTPQERRGKSRDQD
jgi:hypothetical protein